MRAPVVSESVGKLNFGLLAFAIHMQKIGHIGKTIHDEKTAAAVGFSGGAPIHGTVHWSQFTPLMLVRCHILVFFLCALDASFSLHPHNIPHEPIPRTSYAESLR